MNEEICELCGGTGKLLIVRAGFGPDDAREEECLCEKERKADNEQDQGE